MIHHAVKRISCAAAACLIILAAGCAPEEADSPEVIRPVRSVEVFASGAMRTRKFSGVSRAGLESTLSFKVSGTVDEVLVKVGDRVERNDLIARLDPELFRLQEQQAEAALEQATAGQRSAASTYERVKALYVNGNASRNDLDEARAAFESADAQVRAAQKQLEQARLQLSYTRLTAPVKGAIAAVAVEENENVSPGLPVAVLTSGAKPEVTVAVPEVLIGGIREGDAAEVSFDVIAGQTFDARIIEVGVAPVGGATTYPVTVRMDDDAKTIRPGMAATVGITFGGTSGRDVFMVPSHAVAGDSTGRFVFVLESNNDGTAVVRRRAVETGDITDDGLEVLSGLTDGERIVTAGVSKLYDGLVVKDDGSGK